ncbi:MAG: hypothetical protein ACO20X_14765, partial [Alphaproteobacteria bacterium]
MTLASVSEFDADSPKFLRGKYAICGIGETTYRRGSEESTRNLATWAIKNAMDDAGIGPSDIDGMLSYSGNDSVHAPWVAGDLGIRLNFYMDVHGGGSSTEALIGIAIGVIEAGMCKTVAIYRAMNGYSQVRIGGTGARSRHGIQRLEEPRSTGLRVQVQHQRLDVAVEELLLAVGECL